MVVTWVADIESMKAGATSTPVSQKMLSCLMMLLRLGSPGIREE